MKTAHEFEIEMAVESGKEALQAAIATLQRATAELERYASNYNNASTPAEKAKVLNWAINHLACNIMPNLRIDLLANAQANLARVD